jgi:hypothetical protein
MSADEDVIVIDDDTNSSSSSSEDDERAVDETISIHGSSSESENQVNVNVRGKTIIIDHSSSSSDESFSKTARPIQTHSSSTQQTVSDESPKITITNTSSKAASKPPSSSDQNSEKRTSSDSHSSNEDDGDSGFSRKVESSSEDSSESDDSGVKKGTPRSSRGDSDSSNEDDGDSGFSRKVESSSEDSSESDDSGAKKGTPRSSRALRRNSARKISGSHDDRSSSTEQASTRSSKRNRKTTKQSSDSESSDKDDSDQEMLNKRSSSDDKSSECSEEESTAGGIDKRRNAAQMKRARLSRQSSSESSSSKSAKPPRESPHRHPYMERMKNSQGSPQKRNGTVQNNANRKRPTTSVRSSSDSESLAKNESSHSESSEKSKSNSEYSRIVPSSSSNSPEDSDVSYDSSETKDRCAGRRARRNLSRRKSNLEADESKDSDRKPPAEKRNGKKVSSKMERRIIDSQGATKSKMTTSRCPICFTRVSEESIDYHIATCGQNLTGEFQGTTVQASGAFASRPLENQRKPKVESSSENESTRQKRNSSDNSDEDQKPPAKVSRASGRKERKSAAVRHQPQEKAFSLARGACLDDRDGATKKALKGGAKRKFEDAEETRVNQGENWRTMVENVLRQVRQDRDKRRDERLRKALRSKNELLGKQRRPKSQLQYPLLHPLRNKPLDSSYLKDGENPVPRDDYFTIFLKKHFSSPDDKVDSSENETSDQDNDSGTDPKNVIEIDSRSADDPSGIIQGLSPSKKKYAPNIKEFHVKEVIGVGYEEVEADKEIDRVLEGLRNLDHDRDEVHSYLALLLLKDVERVQKRFEKAKCTQEPKRLHDNPYENIMSSFRDLFCRRCLTYDCNIHGLAEKYCPTVQADIAIQREEAGFWGVSTKVVAACPWYIVV